MASISEIKAQNNVVDYARNVLGWDVRSPGDHTYSIDKGSNNRCLWVYDDWFYDFKLGVGGDVIDLCALVRHGGYSRVGRVFSAVARRNAESL